MRIEAVIKQIGELHEGSSKLTGKEWKAAQILLEWEDGEVTNRVWAMMFNEVLDEFQQVGMHVGDGCVVTFSFSARSYRTGYHKTEVNIISISKANL